MKNEATGVQRQTATNDSGYYVIPNLQPGLFQIGSDRFAIHMWYESLAPAPLGLVSAHSSATEDPEPASLPHGPAARPKTVSKFIANRRRKARARSVVVADPAD